MMRFTLMVLTAALAACGTHYSSSSDTTVLVTNDTPDPLMIVAEGIRVAHVGVGERRCVRVPFDNFVMTYRRTGNVYAQTVETRRISRDDAPGFTWHIVGVSADQDRILPAETRCG